MSLALSSNSLSIEQCFHCGEALRGTVYTATIDAVAQPMCCIGCQAAAEMIENSGMGDFYRQRSSASTHPAHIIDNEHWQQFDIPELHDKFISTDANIHSASIAVNGIYCSACTWLIERSYQNISGIHDLGINLAQKRIRISWNADTLKFSEVLMVLVKLGYQPQPLSSLDSNTHSQQENRSALKRIAVAGLGMMQVMGLAFALYANEANGGMDANTEKFLNLISMIVTTAVVFYSGAPFFSNALRDLRSRHLGMDVPVALAIGTAYSSSLWNTFSHNGATVYFDSAVMFVFFLSLGRFLEMRIRHQALSSSEALSQLLPALVKLQRGNEQLNLPPQQLQRGDIIKLYAGDTVPCDANITAGEGLFDESLLTGEALAIRRRQGDEVIGGTVLQGGLQGGFSNPSITIQASHMGQDSTLAKIGTLLDQAQSQRPRQSLIADRLARYFVAAILIITATVGLAWWYIDSSQALAVMLSVLVVTCPCALSLATPAAITAASHFLSRHGIVLSNSNALEALTRIDQWYFDKTGTLTTGKMRLLHTHVLGDADQQQCIKIAALLEQESKHPIAQAFNSHFNNVNMQALENYREVAGDGVSASIDGVQYLLGRPAWIVQQTGLSYTGSTSDSLVQLCRNNSKPQLLAQFGIGDSLRKDAPALLDSLQKNYHCQLLSGDHLASVARTAEQLGMHDYQGEMRPENKLEQIKKAQQQYTVAMVGDGINDAPVLAQADVSITLAGGSQLAQSHADIILLNNQISSIQLALSCATRCQSIIRQNLGWALLYNLCALPLAASGLLSPWMAALGMSLSSLLVVLNASRLNLQPRAPL